MRVFEKDIEPCLQVLRKGGIILYPTDTIWGIGCDATNAAAVQRIFELKKRAESNSMIILLADERALLHYVAALDLEVFNYLDTVTKPTTVVYEGALHLADNVINADGSIGIRIVKDEFCKDLVLQFRKPIVSTSANVSGTPTPKCYSEITDEIKSGVDYIVKYRQDDTTPRQASAVIKWKNGGQVTVIRP
ncbi:MAG: threonylcarbamoyl-AMP synthase [Chitinophagaceae bacterium]|nr:threonylcarbamoyl-AMP synthase [Chitinophagaceae bacterium]